MVDWLKQLAPGGTRERDGSSLDRLTREFTPTALAILAAAQEEAGRCGHRSLRTEHVVLAVLNCPYSLACEAIQLITGAQTDALITALRSQLRVQPPRQREAPSDFDLDLVTALSRSQSIALARKSPRVSSDHLIFGILATVDCGAAAALYAQGVSPDEFDAALTDLIDETP